MVMHGGWFMALLYPKWDLVQRSTQADAASQVSLRTSLRVFVMEDGFNGTDDKPDTMGVAQD